MKKKWLGITLALLVVVVAAVAAVITLGDTKADAADAPVVMLDKTEYAYGEKLQISWSGLTDEWRTANIEMRIDQGHNLPDNTTNNGTAFGDWDYFYMQKGTSDKVKGESGTATYPDDFVKKRDMTPGKYTLWIFRYTPRKAISERIEFTVYEMGISVEENVSLTDGKLVVNYKGMKDSFSNLHNGTTWYDLELRVVPGHGLTDGQLIDGTNYPRFDYSDLTNQFSGGTQQSTAPITESGTRVFPDDGFGTGSNSQIALKPGKYTIAVFAYGRTGTPRVSNKLEIELVFTEISTDKKDYGYGEDIVFSHTGIPTIMKTTGISSESELRIYNEKTWINGYGGTLDAPAGTSGGGSAGGFEFGEEAAAVYPLASGSVSYPTDKGWGSSLAPGKYRAVMVYHDGKTAHAASHYIEFEIHKPEIKLSKNSFAFGEGISLSYKYCTEQWLIDNMGQSYLSIDIFHKGYGPSNDANKGIVARQTEHEHVIFHKTASVTQTKLSEATIEFPYADNDGKANRFPLPAGEYRVIVRLGGLQLNDTEYTFTVEEPVFKIEPELNDSISLRVSVLMGDDILKVPGKTRTLKMNFNFNEDALATTAYTSSLDAETGLTWYTFIYENILPQQMMDSISAELVVEGDIWDVSLDTPHAVTSVSVKTVSDYSIREYADRTLAKAEYSDAHDLIVAMLNYGAAAQEYFGYNTENLANAGLEKSIENVAISDATSVVAVDGTCEGGYAWKAVTLNLQSKLAFRFKFEAADIANVTISCNSQNYTMAANEDMFLAAGNNTYYFYYGDIAASQYNTSYQFTMTVGNTTSTVTYSVNSFVKWASTSDSADLVNICTAIYNYGLLAASYK